MHRPRTAACLVAAAVALALSACPKPHDSAFDDHDIRFTMAPGWNADEEPHKPGVDVRFVSAHGPEHALVMIASLPAAAPTTLAGFAATVAGKRVAAVEQKLAVGGVKLGGEDALHASEARARIGAVDVVGIGQEFSVTLLGQAVPHTAQFFMVPLAGRKVFVTLQAPTKNLADERDGMQKILDTLALAPADHG
ncbi:MAG TPA: hypothetical protein VGO62_05420 [Myxococcota bacterium]|jgi:hypothetical protein